MNLPDMKSAKVPAGKIFSIGPVPGGTSIAVAPGAGGTMRVQFRVSDGGPLRDWPAGTTTNSSTDVLNGPVHRIVFSAQTADGVAEWGW